MATNLWGNVYYKDTFAGILSQAGRRPMRIHLRRGLPAEIFCPLFPTLLPLRAEPNTHHLSEYGLHPFFDNLCAEGWLKDAQARALGLRRDDRFPLLLAFGADLAGAVSVIDPDPAGDIKIDRDDPVFT